METEKKLLSNAFTVFSKEAPDFAAAWMKLVQELSEANSLDYKTKNIAYIAVLAALNRVNGIPFHVKMAKDAGVTKEEIISAILVGLAPAGHVVTEVLPAAIEAFNTN